MVVLKAQTQQLTKKSQETKQKNNKQKKKDCAQSRSLITSGDHKTQCFRKDDISRNTTSPRRTIYLKTWQHKIQHILQNATTQSCIYQSRQHFAQTRFREPDNISTNTSYHKNQHFTILNYFMRQHFTRHDNTCEVLLKCGCVLWNTFSWTGMHINLQCHRLQRCGHFHPVCSLWRTWHTNLVNLKTIIIITFQCCSLYSK